MKYKYSFISFDCQFNHRNNFLTSFLTNYEYTDNYNQVDFLFIGSFCYEYNYYNIIEKLNCVKILYITEPIEFMNEYCSYKILYNQNKVDVLFGCVENNNEKIISFKSPFWYYEMKNHFENVSFFDDINDYVNTCENVIDKRFCSLLNSHDVGGTRVPIYNKLKDFGFIECPGKLLHNCSSEESDSLRCNGLPNNSQFLKLFKFNICSENFLVKIPGYISEKIICAFIGGAIPIYCGSFGKNEEKIFNKDRILLFDPNDEESMEKVRQKVDFLLNNPEEFIKFYKQPVFCDSAYEYCRTYDVNIYYMIKTIHKMVGDRKCLTV